jgi:hypothetical protein
MHSSLMNDDLNANDSNLELKDERSRLEKEVFQASKTSDTSKAATNSLER